MKTYVAIVISWLLYLAGDLASRPFFVSGAYARLMYPLYNNLMLASYNVQEWGQTKGPWK